MRWVALRLLFLGALAALLVAWAVFRVQVHRAHGRRA